MVTNSSDYRDIRSLAVHIEDVVTAFETNLTPGPRAVLRVTAPFAGRMRARLHVEGGEGYTETPRPLHLDPGTVLDTERIPDYPRAADTEERLRANPDTPYSIDRHHAFHTERVAAWRASVGDAVLESADIDGPQGPHHVRIAALGRATADDP